MPIGNRRVNAGHSGDSASGRRVAECGFRETALDGAPMNPIIRIVGLFGVRLVEPEIVFKALADRTRQRAFALLSRHELGVSELVELLRQPQSTVSRHLKVLKEAGLIVDTRRGHSVYYAVPAPQGDADDVGLTDKVLGWASEQPLPSGMTARLETVLSRRCEMSERFFSEVGGRWDTMRQEAFGDRFHLEAFTALLPSHWRVADIGTGTGYMLGTLARQFDSVVAVDPVDAMLDAARQRAKRLSLDNVELLKGDLSNLPISGSTVDLAVAVLVLHHVPRPKDAIRELFRVARAGGQVLIVEQTAHRNEAFRSRMQDRWWGFAPDEFSDMLAEAGFERLRVRTLVTADSAVDAPELFVATRVKPGDG